jgi:hypothetical protein
MVKSTGVFYVSIESNVAPRTLITFGESTC